MGSGEMSPAMGPLHAELLQRSGAQPGEAVLLDTTYGFQENADELSKKLERYFKNRVRQPISVASLRRADPTDPVALERAYRLLGSARYIFAGPGSPSYAARQWQRSRVPQLLRVRVADGACLTLASAAAITIGRYALPVYEIYKVGEPPHWIEGLDLLGAFGLHVAVIPHYDNREGGTHDTRYCYIGERRLIELEKQLPTGVRIFGIAEHTAAILDFARRTLEIRGRGFAALRDHGVEQRFEAGQVIPLSELRVELPQVPRAQTPLTETENGAASPVGRLRSGFRNALQQFSFEPAIRRLLELEAWLTEQRNNGVSGPALEDGRSAFRSMLVELGEVADLNSLTQEALRDIVEIAVRLRDQARHERRFAEADRLRDALQRLGIEMRDQPAGAHQFPASPH
jgi:hypothetical protein